MQYLDEHLDFSKYSYTFIGRAPIVFKNIKVIEPLNSLELGNQLRKHDIYLALSKSESCSNSLLEAINCGLPVVARNSGCYPEVIRDGGVIFYTTEESVDKINLLANHIEEYQKQLPFYKMNEIGKKYIEFILEVDQALKKKLIQSKKNTYLKKIHWDIVCLYIKIYIKITDKFFR